MTKRIKRIAALLLAAVLLICVSFASLAEGNDETFEENTVSEETTEVTETAVVESAAEDTIPEEAEAAAETETVEEAEAAVEPETVEEPETEEEATTIESAEECSETTEAVNETLAVQEETEVTEPETTDNDATVEPEAADEEIPGVTEEPETSAETSPEDADEENKETDEETVKVIRAWIESEDDKEIYIDEKATLIAKTNPELNVQVTWQIRDEQWEKDIWEDIGTSEKLNLNVTASMKDYLIRFVTEDGTVSETFRLNAVEKPAEETTGEQNEDTCEETGEEALNSETVETVEETNEEAAEETAAETAEETVNAEAEEAAEENTDEQAEDVEAEEPVSEIIRAWITVNSEDSLTIGDTAILAANAEPEMTGVNIWQTRNAEDEEENWHKIGYGDGIAVEITEENVNNLYRFVMQDGTISEEFRLTTVAEETAEEFPEDAELPEECEASEEPVLPETPEEPEEKELPEDRSVAVVMSCDDEHPGFGSVIHFTAELTGYEELEYTVQWITSTDNENWTEVEGADSETMDVVVTRDNYRNYWRVKVTIVGFKDVIDE